MLVTQVAGATYSRDSTYTSPAGRKILYTHFSPVLHLIYLLFSLLPRLRLYPTLTYRLVYNIARTHTDGLDCMTTGWSYVFLLSQRRSTSSEGSVEIRGIGSRIWEQIFFTHRRCHRADDISWIHLAFEFTGFVLFTPDAQLDITSNT